uniref:C-type lectin domain-containing protein n=1 Tax=Sinocyclocheilus rhinocerous TaxID=307959 RepID=A0A673KKA7_9TELE
MKMTLTGLLLFVLGLNAEEYYRAHIYVSTPMAWIQANSYCRTYYTDLSTITSQEEHQKLVAAAGGTFSQAWIGLFRAAEKPNTLVWSNQESYSFTKLNNNDKTFNCVYATELEWYIGYCKNKLPFFCHFDYELRLIRMNMTWEDNLTVKSYLHIHAPTH